MNTPTPTPKMHNKLHKAWRTLRGSIPTTRLVALTVVAVIMIIITLTYNIPPLAQWQAWSQSNGHWFIPVFFSCYVLVTQFPIPRTFFTLTSGILFGPSVGIGIALAATTVSAGISLLTMRYLVGDWIGPTLTHPAVNRINTRLKQRGWLAVTSLRMIAGVPFCAVNYAAALTPIPIMSFCLATLVGSAPGTVMTVIFGDALTGHYEPQLIIFSLLLACLGAIGLVLDHRLPVKDKD
ncbi:TVP38/TMEM64 family protein [Corynebacterium felinum]|uniref:TVP38/TMEM64 family membrane protein n=1 Tax=Corynebacterium felinum TaxID=131318 RepID=A0ABU2BAN2_9CORY|nr:TVP38/TMEM64 family protein [Corynebacterium felinum]MDF5820029.1 TVP38/TMEM64 family protein [Corynebacterium felinum]MDR7355689.1 putative membrane protein YdjX (TVP38/TMEM64 family) [Corynebacterium felinum]WJY95039.1 SNARE associated Golgi protein [Corynebacterium felinum]